jgi:hypothetical protein
MYSKRRKNLGGRRKRSTRKSLGANRYRHYGGSAQMPLITQEDALEMIETDVVDFSITDIAVRDKTADVIFALIKDHLIQTNEQYCDTMSRYLGSLLTYMNTTDRKYQLIVLICKEVAANKELRNKANTARNKTPEQEQILLNNQAPPKILMNIMDWLSKKGD